jgi:hypothetical protein
MIRESRKELTMTKSITILGFMTIVFLLTLQISHARYLSTDTGRFMTMDTYRGNNEDPLSLHKYVYAEGNPVDGSDPNGNYDVGDVMGAMAIIAGLDGFALPVFALATEPLSNSGTGFAYYFESTKPGVRHGVGRNSGYPTLCQGKTIVENPAGIAKMKADITEAKQEGNKFKRIAFYGHGDSVGILGSSGVGAAIFWRLYYPSKDPTVLNGYDVQNLFRGSVFPNLEVDFEFCHSLDYPAVPGLFTSLAPHADIWGVHGEKRWFGNYTPLPPGELVHYGGN